MENSTFYVYVHTEIMPIQKVEILIIEGYFSYTTAHKKRDFLIKGKRGEPIVNNIWIEAGLCKQLEWIYTDYLRKKSTMNNNVEVVTTKLYTLWLLCS